MGNALPIGMAMAPFMKSRRFVAHHQHAAGGRLQAAFGDHFCFFARSHCLNFSADALLSALVLGRTSLCARSCVFCAVLLPRWGWRVWSGRSCRATCVTAAPWRATDWDFAPSTVVTLFVSESAKQRALFRRGLPRPNGRIVWPSAFIYREITIERNHPRNSYSPITHDQ
jgi:hypothetical protein